MSYYCGVLEDGFLVILQSINFKLCNILMDEMKIIVETEEKCTLHYSPPLRTSFIHQILKKCHFANAWGGGNEEL